MVLPWPSCQTEQQPLLLQHGRCDVSPKIFRRPQYLTCLYEAYYDIFRNVMILMASTCPPTNTPGTLDGTFLFSPPPPGGEQDGGASTLLSIRARALSLLQAARSPCMPSTQRPIRRTPTPLHCPCRPPSQSENARTTIFPFIQSRASRHASPREVNTGAASTYQRLRKLPVAWIPAFHAALEVRMMEE